MLPAKTRWRNALSFYREFSCSALVIPKAENCDDDHIIQRSGGFRMRVEWDHMSLWQSIRGLGRSRRALVLTPLIIVFNALLIWTLAHTEIVAFVTIFVAALVLISGAFWATGPTTNHRIALGDQRRQPINRL